MRLAIVGTAHLQARDLDRGLEMGHRSVGILARVQSSRAKDYVREFNAALAPWRREPAVREFVRRAREELRDQGRFVSGLREGGLMSTGVNLLP